MLLRKEVDESAQKKGYTQENQAWRLSLFGYHGSVMVCMLVLGEYPDASSHRGGKESLDFWVL